MKALALLAVLAACGPSSTRPQPPQLPVVASTPTPSMAAPTTTWNQLKGPIKSVEVNSTDVGLRNELATLFKPEVGQLVDRVRLRDELDAAMAVRGVESLFARGVQLDGGIKLIVDVTLHPILRKLTALEVGGAPITLTGMAASRIGMSIDPVALDRITGDLRDRYRDRGYQSVMAAWRRVAVKDGVEVVIEVTAGDATVIGGFDVKGNKALSSKQLTDALAKHLVVGHPVKEEAITLAATELSALYWEKGYANVKINSPEPKSGRVKLVYEIVEGDQFRLGPIAITGVPASEAPRYLKVLGIKQGDIFSRNAIVTARQAVVDTARSVGINVSEVLPLTKVDLAKKLISLTFEISKSP